MKRILALTLILLFALPLFACGTSTGTVQGEAGTAQEEIAAPNPFEQIYEKYADIIDALEAEDYDRAVEAVEGRRPTPAVVEVKITMDNLWDYFEISESRQEETDAMGNLTSRQISYNLTLKDPYKLADPEVYSSDVSVGYEYDQTWSMYSTPCTMDFDTFTCDGRRDGAPLESHESKMLHLPAKNPTLYYERGICPQDKSYVADTIVVKNFVVLNASGTIYLTSN